MAYLPHGTTISIGGTDVGGLIGISFPERNKGEAETTTSSSGGDRSFLPGLRDAGAFSITCRHDPDDTGQQALITNYEADQTTAEFIITLPASATTASGSKTYTYDGFVTGIPEDLDLIADEAAEVEYTCRATAGVTES